MQAISEAMIALEEDAHHRAEQILLNAIEAIELLPELNDETFGFERERSLAALRDLVKQVEKKKPVTELESLEQQLRRAIEEQEFELAAQLRDRIRALRNAAR
jgi:excinuclease UvrABC helicase subunit UvrB